MESMAGLVSELFDPDAWRPVAGFEFTDITYHRAVDQGTVRIAFHRPEVRNAFRPHTVDELYRALDHARMSTDVGCVLLTGNGPSPRDGVWAFSAGGDQRIRGRDGYKYAGGEDGETIDPGADRTAAHPRGPAADPVHAQGRDLRRARAGRRGAGTACTSCATSPWPAPSTPASSRPTPTWRASTAATARRTSPARSGRSSPGRCSSSGREYTAADYHRMGAVNAVVPHAELERTALEWAAAINAKSPTAVRMLKYAFNLVDDGLVGQQLFAGEATRLAYGTDEAAEGRDAFLEKRPPDWSGFPYHY